MVGEYRIGDYIFASEIEHQEALKDYEQCERFAKQLNLKNPKIARQVYERLEQSPHLMRTVVGEAFKDKLVEIYIHDLVKEKKKRLDQLSKQSWLDALKRAKNDKVFAVYWWFFRGITLGQIVYYLCVFYERFVVQHEYFGVITKLSYILALYRITARGFLMVTILTTLILSLYFFVLQLKNVVGSNHRLNYLLMSGFMMCTYFLSLNL